MSNALPPPRAPPEARQRRVPEVPPPAGRARLPAFSDPPLPADQRQAQAPSLSNPQNRLRPVEHRNAPTASKEGGVLRSSVPAADLCRDPPQDLDYSLICLAECRRCLGRRVGLLPTSGSLRPHSGAKANSAWRHLWRDHIQWLHFAGQIAETALFSAKSPKAKRGPSLFPWRVIHPTTTSGVALRQ